jgi:hypothetical protein
MGAWGYGIRQDDFVCDVIGAFEDRLKAGGSVADATQAVTSQFGAAIEDSDDGPLFWIALADAQWTYGALDASVLERVTDDFESGRSLRPWEEDPRGLARRRTALESFVRRIGVAKRRPKRPPRAIARAPKFRPGDCLSIRLADGLHAAAIVLAADHSVPEYGKNLVAVLDYLSTDTPAIEVFRGRKWLVLSHDEGRDRRDIAWYYPVGFRAVKSRLEVVGQVEIHDSDPKDSDLYCGWAGIGERATQRRDRDADGR